MEDVSRESPRVRRVDGFLHRADTPRSRAVRVDRAVVCSSAYRAFHRHGAPNSRVDRPTNRRRIPDDTAPRWLHRDRDRAYSETFRRRVAGIAIADVVSAPASPWQNPYVERVIGSIRRECPDHVVVLNQVHLRRVLTIHSEYYHRSRTHLGLNKAPPDSSTTTPLGVPGVCADTSTPIASQTHATHTTTNVRTVFIMQSPFLLCGRHDINGRGGRREFQRMARHCP